MDLHVIDRLAGELGVRFAGTPAEEMGARLIKDEFEALGLETRLDWFQFLGWELLGEPELEISGPIHERVPCFALVYGPPTPEGGLELPLRRVGKATLLRGVDCRKYALIDPETGIQRAHLIARMDGPGCAMTLLDPALAVPTVLVGGEEAQAIAQWADEHTSLTAKITLASKLTPEARSCNVVATLPGTNTEKGILLLAHHDTQYNSPGAVDDASGVQALLALAKQLAENRPSKTVRFVVFGAEEYMLLGSRHYAQMLQETDSAGEIEAIVNVDMAGCNAPTWVNFTEDERDFKLRVARVFERLGVFERYGDVHWQCPPWPTGDHAPFVDAGLPALYISHRGQRYPHLHLPSDTVDKVDPEVLELAVNYLRAIVEDLVM
jgi:hypothetical protein